MSVLQVMLHTSYRHSDRHRTARATARMLLDLSPEIINLITDILSPRPPKNSSRILHSCPHFAHDQNQDRLAVYDVSETPGGYETDVVRFAMAHPYVAKCIENCGRRIEVDATVMEGLEELGVVPCMSSVPEEVRRIVRYVTDPLFS
jgi:hypothetical protein